MAFPPKRPATEAVQKDPLFLPAVVEVSLRLNGRYPINLNFISATARALQSNRRAEQLHLASSPPSPPSGATGRLPQTLGDIRRREPQSHPP
jgi:hypothetical protein